MQYTKEELIERVPNKYGHRLYFTLNTLSLLLSILDHLKVKNLALPMPSSPNYVLGKGHRGKNNVSLLHKNEKKSPAVF